MTTTGDADAQVGQGRAPWCADMLNGIAECHYYSFEQCMARASGISNSCFVNPYFVPPLPQGARAPNRRVPRKTD